MLRIHCVQLFYNLSDPGMENLLYEVESVRRSRVCGSPVRCWTRRRSIARVGASRASALGPRRIGDAVSIDDNRYGTGARSRHKQSARWCDRRQQVL